MHLDLCASPKAGNTSLECKVNGIAQLKAVFSATISSSMIRGHATIVKLKAGDTITVYLSGGGLTGTSLSFSAFYGFLLSVYY